MKEILKDNVLAREVNRRDFLKVVGAGLVAFYGGGLLRPQEVKAEGGVFRGDVWTISGVPDKVPTDQVDRANLGRGFKNTLFGGSEMVLAEPGVLKVGWDFPQDQFKAAGEHIYRYDPGNQAILQTDKASWNAQEGGFAMFNGNPMVIEVGGNGEASFRLDIGGPEANHNIVVIRGLHPDGSTPKDRNRIANLTGYTAGAVLADMYPRGGFVSQGHFEQIVENALGNNPNCGAEGCRTVRAYFLDLNTGAFAVIAKSGGGPWEERGRNWDRK